jgi:K+-transporting ATPase KdpF subunit
MEIMHWVALAAAVALLIYLFVALFKPEAF